MAVLDEESVYVQAMLRMAVPCFACEGMKQQEVPADWVVTLENGTHWFLCDPCLGRWVGFGFGRVYDRGARWVRL